MRILYLAHRLPFPPDKGERIRAGRMLRHLAAGHEVWCACFVDDRRDERHVAELRATCHHAAAIRLDRRAALVRGACALAGGQTLTQGFYRHPRMTRLIREWSEQAVFDVVVAFSSSMAPYALLARAGRRVLDLCDLDSQKWLDYAARSRFPLRALYAAEGRRLRAREEAWIRAFDAAILISRAEAGLLADVQLRRRVCVIGNGVELPAPSDRVEPEAPPVVGFVGDLSYRPNVEGLRWFIGECWDAVRARVPGAELHIIGRRPAEAVRRLGSRAGVAVSADVPDVRPHLARMHVSIAPLHIARGVQNKVLEAMAQGKAIVLTSAAARGIEAVDGVHWSVADDAEPFARGVADLLTDVGKRRALGEAAARFVTQHCSWPAALRAVERVVCGQALSPATEERHEPVTLAVGCL